MKKYIVKLTEKEREELAQMISTGKASARKLMHARILLKADESAGGPHWSDEHIGEAIGASLSTIGRVRQKFVEEGGDAALSRRKGSGLRDLKIDGECEAHLVALTCSTAPIVIRPIMWRISAMINANDWLLMSVESVFEEMFCQHKMPCHCSSSI